ncbi:hypothetical protein SAMN05428966_102138 [Massilia sp. PDC64]|nr:replication protein P [Massilia sp. PDC64]SDC69788.1 hypothetical protein SAMN05428966_102138 [Massilia sp. PDC64]
MSNLSDSRSLPPAPSTRPRSKWFEPVENLGISMIDHLYNRLDGAYPHKWRSNFADQQAIDNWAESWVETFEEEGITPNDVKIGLRECRRRFAWPPSVAEFVQACRPQVDPLRAYYEAVAGVQARFAGEHGTWSHPAIYWAAMPMAVELREQTFSAVKARWETALAEQLGRGEWEEIPAPMLQLTAPGKSTTSQERAAEAIQRALGQVVHKPADGNPLGWARRVLDRFEAGDKVTPTMLSMAREALSSTA